MIVIDESWKIEDDLYKCPTCGLCYSKMGISTHIWRKHGDGKNHNPNMGYDIDRVVWNKGLTKSIDIRVLKNTESVKEFYKTHSSNWKGKKHSKKTIDLLRKKAGGYRKGSGRGKHGWYKGYWCDSSWELAYVIYNIDHNIKFERNTKKFKYIHSDTEHSYTPDFYIKSGDYYIEIKGYINDKWTSKIKQFKSKLKIIGEIEIKPILKYIVSKYGSDFTKLYE